MAALQELGSRFHKKFDRQQDPEDSEEPFSEDSHDSEPFVDFPIQQLF